MSYRFADGLRAGSGWNQRNCPKHVEFYSKTEFEKLVHLVGFITRIYHGTRLPERLSIEHASYIPKLPEVNKERSSTLPTNDRNILTVDSAPRVAQSV